ncbi:MMPL family transporter [bacterium]|nr:MMPL family transporter [bacterium]
MADERPRDESLAPAASSGVTGQTGTTAAERFTAGLARFIVRHPQTVIALAAILTVLASVFAWFHLTLDTDRNRLIGENLPYNQRYIALEKEFGDLAALTVVVEARSRKRAQEFALDLDAACSKDAENFGPIFYRVDLDRLKGHVLKLAQLEDLKELRTTLEDAKLPDRMAAKEGMGGLFTGLGAHVRQRVESGDVDRGEGGADMGGILFGVIDGVEGALRNGAPYSTPWEGKVDDGWAWEPVPPEGSPTSRYGPSGARLIVLIQPVPRPGVDTAEQSVHALRALLDNYKKDPKWADVVLGLTGGPVLAVDEMETYRRDATIATVVGFFAVILLFMISFRRVLGPLCAGICLAMAIAFTLAFAAIWPGHLNLISIVFLEILIGLGIDFGIHLISRYDEERTYGMEPGPALEAALGLTGRASAAGAMTTALAFMATLLADFRGIQEFGVIAAVGILFCLATMLVVLPAMIVLADRGRGGMKRRPRPGFARTRGALALDRWSIHDPWTLVIACVLLGWLALTVAALRLRYSGNLLELQATGLESVKYANDLVQGDTIANLVCDSPEQLERYTAKLRSLERRIVKKYECLPVQQEEKLAEIAKIGSILESVPPGGVGDGKDKPRPVEDPTPPADAVDARKALENFRGGVSEFASALRIAEDEAGNSGRSDDVRGIEQILRRLDALLEAANPEAPDPLKRALGLVEFEKGFRKELSDLMVRLRQESASPNKIGPDDLPPALRDRFVGKSGKFLIHIYPGQKIFDDKPLEEFIRTIRSVPEFKDELTGVPVQIYETGKRMKEGYEKAGLISFLFIALYLLVHYRSFARAGITLAALVVGAAIGTGALALKGETLNPANMLAIPLTLGIGVCYAIQLVHRHRQAYARPSVAGPQPVIATSTGRGVVLSAGTNVVGFGALALAQHQGTASIGWAITFGVLGCLVAALFFLPALLRIWQGPIVEVELKGQPGPKIGPEGKVARPGQNGVDVAPPAISS